jgi:magnesium-transporting ATPase (P-type)
LFALAFDLGLWLHEGANGWPIEGSAIALILLFNAGLGLYQEYRSEAALARLKALAGRRAWVLRDGEFVRLPTQDLVPGDWIRLEAGDRVPADGALHDPRGVMIDESLLTGESVPVDKGEAHDAFDRTPGVMQQTPRPADSPLLDPPSVRFILAVGSMKAALALALLGILPKLGYDLESTRATAFHFMAIGQLFLTYPSRHTWMRPLTNRYLHGAVAGGIAVQLLAASVPAVSRLLGNAAIPVELWTVVFGGALVSWGLAEVATRAIWRHAGRRMDSVFDATPALRG